MTHCDCGALDCPRCFPFDLPDWAEIEADARAKLAHEFHVFARSPRHRGLLDELFGHVCNGPDWLRLARAHDRLLKAVARQNAHQTRRAGKLLLGLLCAEYVRANLDHEIDSRLRIEDEAEPAMLDAWACA